MAEAEDQNHIPEHVTHSRDEIVAEVAFLSARRNRQPLGDEHRDILMERYTALHGANNAAAAMREDLALPPAPGPHKVIVRAHFDYDEPNNMREFRKDLRERTNQWRLWMLEQVPQIRALVGPTYQILHIQRVVGLVYYVVL